MPRFLLTHRHAADECGASLAAWRGYPSPLRGLPTLSSCAFGGHRVWWEVEATDDRAALTRLPAYVAERTEVARVDELEIP